jgi:predicted esterase
VSKTIDLHWYHESPAAPKGAVVFLPGRGNYGYNMVRTYTRVLDLEAIALVATTPRLDQGWYPPPNGPTDQKEAVSGLDRSDHAIDKIIEEVCETYHLPREKVILSGFSMGGVAGVHWSTQTKVPVGGMICHSGAILEPWSTPKAKHEMPIILNHGWDDYCFSWDERYMPMKSALTNRGYNVWLAERTTGNHFVHGSDVMRCKTFLEGVFDTNLDWQPRWKKQAEAA